MAPSQKQLQSMIDAVRYAEELDVRRETALSSTEAFGEAMGVNVYDPRVGKVPWMSPGVHGRICTLLDKIVKTIDNPIKIIAIPRGHFKTSICACALTKMHMLKPWGRSGLCGAREPLAQKALKQMSQIWKSEQCQELFSDVLFPPNDREAYQTKQLNLNHPRVGGEPSVKAFGTETSTTGFHFDTVLWIDDLIDRIMAKSIDEMDKAYEAFKDMVGAIADPGCEIWLTFTRYNTNDPYSYILEKDSEYWPDIVDDPVIESCFEDGDEGKRIPIFPMRFCDKRDEVDKAIEWKGQLIDVPRKSLQGILDKYGMQFFSGQYMNRPVNPEDTSFEAEWFDDVLNVDGSDFFDWINKKENFEKIAPFPEESRGPFEIAVLGDPAYGDKKHNDSAVLWVIAVDRFNHWFYLDYRRAKYGKHRIDDYVRHGLTYYRDYTELCTEQYRRSLAIESHGSGVMIDATIQRLGMEMGIRPRIAELKANSNTKKELRIMSLEPVASSRRMHFCRNVEDGRQQLAIEAQTFRSGGHDDVIDTAANGTQVFRVRNEKKIKKSPMRSLGRLPANIGRILTRRCSA